MISRHLDARADKDLVKLSSAAARNFRISPVAPTRGRQCSQPIGQPPTFWKRYIKRQRDELVEPAMNGLPIDSSWISIYQDQGIVGEVLVGCDLHAPAANGSLSGTGAHESVWHSF